MPNNALLAGTAAIGGTVGALTRWRLDTLVRSRFATAMPAGTLAVNALGCLVLGVLTGFQLSPVWMTLLGTGFCGGLTTFSTLSVDALTLLRARSWAQLAAYLSATVSLGVALFLLGRWVTSALIPL